jgi:hypothetical protein
MPLQKIIYTSRACRLEYYFNIFQFILHVPFLNFDLQVTLQNGRQISIGLKECVGGDAETYINALKDTLQEIASTIASSEEEKKRLLLNSLSP